MREVMEGESDIDKEGLKKGFRSFKSAILRT